MYFSVPKLMCIFKKGYIKWCFYDHTDDDFEKDKYVK